MVSDVATTLRYGCRLVSDWLYIPIRFQHSEGDHTHNAQQEREEGKLSDLIRQWLFSQTNSIISNSNRTGTHSVWDGTGRTGRTGPLLVTFGGGGVLANLLKTAVSVLASTVRLTVSFMEPLVTVSVMLRCSQPAGSSSTLGVAESSWGSGGGAEPSASGQPSRSGDTRR